MRRTYTTIEGESLTRDEYLNYTGLAKATVQRLYNDYQGDTVDLAMNHGIHSGKMRKSPINPNSVEWHNKDGSILTFDEFCYYIELNQEYVTKLYHKHDGDIGAIINKHGKHKKGTAVEYKYHYKDGSPVKATARHKAPANVVAHKYGYPQRDVAACFQSAQYDYKKAYAILDKA